MSLFDILEVSKLLQDKHTDTAASDHQNIAKLENGNTGMNMEEVSDNTDMIRNTKTQSENNCRPPKWLSDVLPRTSHSAHIKVEVTAPAKNRVAPIEGFINLSCSHVKKNRNRGLGKYSILKCKESSELTYCRTLFKYLHETYEELVAGIKLA